MINPITQGATIIVVSNQTEYHTIDDWGLGISNNDYIGNPVLSTNYIEVPGSNRLLDVSDALTGHPTYRSREIRMELGGVRGRIEWDAVISDFRNKINGRLVHIIFDNDPTHYWQGRCEVSDFDRVRTLGTFTLKLPDADPYKYEVTSNIEPWLWDPFDFENDTVPEEPIIIVDGTASVTVPRGNMYNCPTFTVTNVVTPITLKFGTRTYTMKSGKNYFPALLIGGDEEVTLTFSGKGQVVMEYRGGSL